jgi:hypothetical protein
MVFDWVYGRPEAVATAGHAGRLSPQNDGRKGLYHSGSANLRALAGTQVASTRYQATRGDLMATNVLWHGTQTEALELLQALSRNCSCVVTAEGVRLTTCAPHDMLSSDQRAVDGLLFARRIAARLQSEEFDPTLLEVVVSS